MPTATSVRAIPAKLMIDNRVVINNHLKRTRGGKISFTHLLGYAIVQAVKKFPNMNRHFAEVDGKPTLVTPEHVNFGLAIDLPKADGTAGPVMKLARGAGGVLGVRAFAQGGTFAPAAPVRRHAAGGMFAAPRASVVAPAARSAVIAARAVSAVSSTPAAVKQMPAVEQHFHFSTQPDRRTMRQVGAEAYRGAAESWRANG